MKIADERCGEKSRVTKGNGIKPKNCHNTNASLCGKRQWETTKAKVSLCNESCFQHSIAAEL